MSLLEATTEVQIVPFYINHHSDLKTPPPPHYDPDFMLGRHEILKRGQ